MSPEIIRNLGWDLLSGSAHAALLGILVLGVRLLLRRHLAPNWRLVLGSLVLVRLIWPWEISTPVSLFNVTATWLPPINAWSFPIEGWRWCLGVWAAGVAVRLAWILVDWRRVQRWIEQSRSVDARLIVLWEETVQLGSKCSLRVPIRQTSEVANPCVVGLVHPCLLVPLDLETRFSVEEIRLIFLHEMAHLRRFDLWLNGGLEAVRAFHWFNPVLGWVLQRWREDREEACDVHALSVDGVRPVPYGRVLLKCLEGLELASGNPAAIGWHGVTSAAPHSLAHRFESIARFRVGRRTWVVGGCTALSIALLGLTDPEPLPPRRLWLLKSENLSRVLQADPGAPSV